MLHSFENLNKDHFKRIQDRLSDFKESTESQYIEDFQIIHSLLIHMNTSNEFRETQPVLYEFFINEFLYNLSKTLIFARSFRNKETLEIANKILENIVAYGEKILEEDNAKMLETLKFILDSSRAYYKLNDQEENTLFSVIYEIFS